MTASAAMPAGVRVDRVVSRPSVVSYGAGTNSTAMLIGLRERGERPDLILFADTGVHAGTIYKAAGWTVCNTSKPSAKGWNTRKRGEMQTWGEKVRWEIEA